MRYPTWQRSDYIFNPASWYNCQIYFCHPSCLWLLFFNWQFFNWHPSCLWLLFFNWQFFNWHPGCLWLLFLNWKFFNWHLMQISIWGCHLRFGDCEGLGEGKICWGSRREVDYNPRWQHRKPGLSSIIHSKITPALQAFLINERFDVESESWTYQNILCTLQWCIHACMCINVLCT